MADNTRIHPSCEHQEHLVDLFLFQGRPINHDQEREVVVLVNSGYAVGFCPDRFQSLWSGYRVAGFSRDIDYDRPHLYYEDKRLEDAWRIGDDTFGRVDGIQYHVGHLAPNEVINRQFGRLAQMETFFMSNMSPQRGTLNGGVWLDLENKIRNIEDKPGKDHVWAIAGPVFGDDPETITRRNGQKVPIPEAYYYILVDPFRYPWNRESNVDVACFLVPQDTPQNTPLMDLLVDRSELEEATNLSFFPGWSAGPAGGPGPHGPMAAQPEALGTPEVRHRLLRQLL